MAQPTLVTGMSGVAPPPLTEVWPLFLCVSAVIFWILFRPLILWLIEGWKFSTPYVRKYLGQLNHRITGFYSGTHRSYRYHWCFDNHFKLSRAEVQKQSQLLSKKKFAPWRRDYMRAMGIVLSGIAWIVFFTFLFSQKRSFIYVVLAMMGVAHFYRGIAYIERAQKRKHGKKVEEKAIAAFKDAAPAEWDVLPNQLMHKYGDVDLLARLQNDELCAIEIKSWHSFKGFWRRQAALGQIRFQRRAMRASYACIWLPDARTTQSHGRVLIIGGDAKFLVEQIRNFIRQEVTITFTFAPEAFLLSALKKRGFRWNPAAKHWKGKISKRDLADIQCYINGQNGRVEYVADAHPALIEYEAYDFSQAA